ncbi:gliding motility-associated C-terminal domain-containing protein [Cnuella takakiae]|uniref:Gliding motility-associated C-terminal domain-containing protein n=1 Tax=Cnuella takakiae TaxID=1302690 RepID=A0A1M5FKT6_9BACT|nr:PKD domain-containing protein [Cnuella takakiae]OLY93732.1 hypothetical protein BUE76_18965 [Cnuella takakiae]SHF92039.1 gliding motility-associated C-terminal domain-containing protein [Cnuella takakiae]
MKPKRYIFSLLIACLSTLLTWGQYNEAVQFVENRGQWDPSVRFRAEVPAGEIYIHNNGFTVVQHNPQDWEEMASLVHGHNHGNDKDDPRREYPGGKPGAVKAGGLTLRSHAYRVAFAGASPVAALKADKAIKTFNNYILGNDPSKWAFDCKIYQGITIENLYPNIDIRYYSEKGRLKYDLIVKPGGDPSRIKMQYDGVEQLLLKNKELLIPTSVGTLKEMAPYTYQAGAAGRKEIANKYIVENKSVRFDIRNYDRAQPLVIDPTLIFCSLSGSTRDNWGFTATYGPDGSLYGGGIALEGGFPVSVGAFQQTYAGGSNPVPSDIAIIKLTPDGSQRAYATYIGGSGNDQPHSLIVDAQGNLVIAGRTNSVNYPTTGANFGAAQQYDIVVTKLNATGTGLVGSRRIGGRGDDGVNINASRDGANSLQRNYGDDGRSEVILDGAGNVYVASSSRSADMFTRNAGQTTLSGSQDAVILKMTPDLGDVLFCTLFGGTGDDAAYVLSINPMDGNIYVAGGTGSNNLPGNTSGSIYPGSQGNIDGYVAIFTPGGNLLRTTYAGTSGIDQIYGIQFDRFGFPYIMGQTTGNWPIINATYNNAGAKQFIAKLQPDLSAYVYSTVFGKAAAEPSISPTAFLVDRCENVYVSGWGGSLGRNSYPNSGTGGLPITGDAIQPTTDGADFYFFVLRKNATAQLFGSYFGQSGGGADHVDGGTSRFDRNGVIYQAMCANCLQLGSVPFPTTPGAWAETNPSKGCNLGMIKFEMNFSGVGSGVKAGLTGTSNSIVGCVPFTVNFLDTVRNALSYEWQFGDGSPQVTTAIPTVAHTFNRVGTFQVMLVAIDSSTCNIRDTSFMTVRVAENQARIDFNPVKLEPCEAFRYRFDNLSIGLAGIPLGPNSFEWDFGDNTPRVKAGTEPLFHTYANAGTYTVRMFLVDSNFCNVGDSVVRTLRVAALVDAAFETPRAGCAPYTAVFNNTSAGGQSFQWSFGDGATSTESSPVHLYTVPGTYTVRLLVTDSATCNVLDTATTTITVAGVPTANFTTSPQPPTPNTPTTFSPSVSSDVVQYKWLFGDGDSLVTNVGGQVQHQYNSTGTFNACLIVFNAVGCSDTVCVPVETLVRIAADVPTAFTPTSGDVNSVVYVRGFGIAKMTFTIWSRWGVKVFETNDRNTGWDGKYKGTLLPTDVYAYTLNVEFFDGTKLSKKGDITLIR